MTIIEAQQLPVGLLMNCIPAFKLEKSVVKRRFDLLRQRGVKVRTQSLSDYQYSCRARPQAHGLSGRCPSLCKTCFAARRIAHSSPALKP